ncbi:MAG: DUF389 domain-containing protein [Anaerolineales bacterium]|nr:DUF389 domain-containing protein [Anaerolineales bacterium]
MSPQTTESLNTPERLSRARRRRARRMLTQLRADEREAFIEELAHAVSPSIELFLYALLAGLVIGLGFRFDQRALLIAGALVAPRMAPITGLALAAVSGSPRFFLRTLAALAVSLALLSLIAGLSGSLLSAETPELLLARGHTSLNWIDFALVFVGAILMAVSLTRTQRIPALASVAVAYELALPLGAAAVGLAHGLPDLWRGALLTFGLHLTWAIVVGLGTLVVLGFRPLTGYSHSLAAAIVLMGIIALASALGLGVSVMASLPTPTPTPTITPTPSATPTASMTSTVTPTYSVTPSSTASPTSTPTVTPLPPLAIVFRTGDLGGFLRDAPQGEIIGFVEEGDTLSVIGGPEEIGGGVWWLVRTEEGQEGWLLGVLLATITPTSTANPTLTPTPTP